jgi:hypothetical protein
VPAESDLEFSLDPIVDPKALADLEERLQYLAIPFPPDFDGQLGHGGQDEIVIRAGL